MRKIIITLAVIVAMIYNAMATDFDMSVFDGLKFGMTKKQVFALLKSHNLKLEESNNNSGGKIYSYIPNIKFLGYSISEIGFVFERGKIHSFKIELSDNKLDECSDKINTLADCRFETDESLMYRFSNCTVQVNNESQRIFFVPTILKCKE